MSQAEKSKPTPWQLRFSLASVLLAMVVISICLAWSRVHLSSGLLVSFLAIPALIRTALVASREAHSQQPLSMLAKMLEFAFSWVLMVPIGLAAIVIGGTVFMSFGLLGLLVSGFLDRILPSTETPTGFVLAAGMLCVWWLATFGSGGAFLAWGIYSSLAYRPVARI